MAPSNKLVSCLPFRRRTFPPSTSLQSLLQAQHPTSTSSLDLWRKQDGRPRVQPTPSPLLHNRTCKTRMDPLLIARNRSLSCRSRIVLTSTFPPVQARRSCLATSLPPQTSHSPKGILNECLLVNTHLQERLLCINVAQLFVLSRCHRQTYPLRVMHPFDLSEPLSDKSKFVYLDLAVLSHILLVKTPGANHKLLIQSSHLAFFYSPSFPPLFHIR